MRWVRRILIGLPCLLIVALVALYGVSEWVIRRDRHVPLVAFAADRSSAGVAEGTRLAHIKGCLSCHGPEGNGRVLIDNPLVGHLSAPALARIAMSHTDSELERSIRHGVAADGSTLWIMPAHLHTSDDDVARLIGWLRTLQPSPDDVARQRNFGPLGRLLILKGVIPATANGAVVAPARRPADVGRYFVQSVCIGCHMLYRPHEVNGETAPPLAMMASAYDDAAFKRLLRTGVGMTRPDLGLMSDAARKGLRYFTDDEIAAIKAELAKAQEKAPEQP